MDSKNVDAVRKKVLAAVRDARVVDIHTHLYSADFGALLLRGIDELLTYHYLVAETVRWGAVSAEGFWKRSKREQADLVWKTLFVEHSPISEACRGVLTVLERFGLDVGSRDLKSYRAFFDAMSVEQHVDKAFELAGADWVVMTNDPFDDAERKLWQGGVERDPRFKAALRVDQLLNSWESCPEIIRAWGYDVSDYLDAKARAEVRRFLDEWIDRTGALYMAVSLPPNFTIPEDSPRAQLIAECLLPVAEEKGVPFALMIGVKRQINPALKLAGDAVGLADVGAVDRLCASYPDNKFMVTMLARENQHELAVSARKFPNLMVFGCWWFLNNPFLIEEITRMRVDLLGLGMIPQHSDCRVLDQLIYKWEHSRAIIGEVLADKYANLAATGWQPSDAEIKRDVNDLFAGNFTRFLGRE
jgi:hypothetical protein